MTKRLNGWVYTLARCATSRHSNVLWAALWVLLPATAFADVVTDWNVTANKAANATCIGPSGNGPYESRLYTIMHVAIHDALNAIDRRSTPYAFKARIPLNVSVEAAVAAAARESLAGVIRRLPADCILTGLETVEAAYKSALDAIPPGWARTGGIIVGKAAARAILKLRRHDGSDTLLVDPAYPQGDRPGEYRFTPGFDFAFAPGWGSVTPFVLTSGSQFRPPPPHRVRSKAYAADLNEVKAIGGDDVTTPSIRTPDQTEIGLFWRESSPQQWNRIARGISIERALDPWENARLFALLNASLADGYIGSWEAKYHYRFWRPVTAIHMADSDGNPLTHADPTWTPLQFTYPMPDYDSGHAVEGGAAAEVLKRFFGADRIVFWVCSFTLPEGSNCNDGGAVYRLYTSFSQAASENSLSRIYIGIHFRRAVVEGERHGRRIAARAVNLFFRPVGSDGHGH
jgi:hypothetical protein